MASKWCHWVSPENLKSPPSMFQMSFEALGVTQFDHLGFLFRSSTCHKCQSFLSIPGKFLFMPPSPEKMLPSLRSHLSSFQARMKLRFLLPGTRVCRPIHMMPACGQLCKRLLWILHLKPCRLDPASADSLGHRGPCSPLQHCTKTDTLLVQLQAEERG